MTDISLDISGKIDEPTIQALAGVKEVADAFGVPFFIIGAKAKELLLKHVHGLDLRRSTKDMDFGVSLTSWRSFSALKTELIDRWGFAGTNQVQRIRFNDINIDLVPFGPIAGSERMILWPPDESRRMTTSGFEEAPGSRCRSDRESHDRPTDTIDPRRRDGSRIQAQAGHPHGARNGRSRHGAPGYSREAF